MVSGSTDDLDHRYDRELDKAYLVIAGLNTGRGHDLLGVCEVRTVTLPGWAACRALGVPADLLGFVIAQLVSTAWPIAIMRCLSLGAGLAWPGYRLWQKPAASNLLLSAKSTRA
jgi:hypothetical protein